MSLQYLKHDELYENYTGIHIEFTIQSFHIIKKINRKAEFAKGQADFNGQLIFILSRQ